MIFAWKHQTSLSITVAWLRGFQGKFLKRSLYPWLMGKKIIISPGYLDRELTSGTLWSMKSLFLVFLTPSLQSLPYSVLLWEIFSFLWPPSGFYLFSWIQNLITEKNTNKPIVLVTFAFLKLRVWMQNVWLTYLEVLIRIGRSGDWTMSQNTQVLSISLLCQTQLRLQLKVVFPVVIGRLHVSLRALSFSFHVSQRGKWRGTEEGETDTFPSHWTEAFFCLFKPTDVIYP